MITGGPTTLIEVFTLNHSLHADSRRINVDVTKKVLNEGGPDLGALPLVKNSLSDAINECI